MQYVCPPCDQTCDAIIFEEDGICPHCKMNLIELLDSTDVNKIRIHEGSGSFLVEGGISKEDKVIRVFYHQPATLRADSEILFVLPGAGRNGHDYRDAWITISEEQGVMILALQYVEVDYDFADYHLAGMVEHPASPSDESYRINTNSAEWIYRDFDRIFRLVKEEIGSRQQEYDIFGHSAGGQILHRMAIFQDFTNARRIISANSGWYTLPNNEYNYPYGVKDTYVNEDDLRTAFEKKLTILVGELDNENETRGHLRHTPQADAQGLHRFSRANYFVETSRTRAEEINAPYNWNLEVVKGVGHDYQGMSQAAAALLYP